MKSDLSYLCVPRVLIGSRVDWLIDEAADAVTH
jgi:hypothetical protein